MSVLAPVGQDVTTVSATPGPPAIARSNLLVQMGAQLGRYVGYYTLVIGSIFPIALLNTAVLTRYMSPAVFGKLSILYFASALESIVLNLVALRGTERQVWGTSDEGVDVDQAELVEASQRPRVLGTGILMSLAVAAISIAALIPVAPAISQWLLGTPRFGTAVIWAGLSGGLGSVWRLAVNIPRWERRRSLFGITWVARPLVAVALTWPLVANGYGINGAIAATAIGTIVSILLCLICTHSSYSLAFDFSASRKIMRSSADFAAMVIGLYILHSGDVFFLSRFASVTDVGIYRLATNLTSIISYWVSSFLMAWAPLEYSPLFRAAYDRHGRDRTRMRFLTYFALLGVLLVLVLAALAVPLVGIFSVSYRGASGFVAITGAAYLSYGAFLVVARSAQFPRRYFFYGVAAITAAVGLGLSSWLLAPSIGGYGVAIGDVIGAAMGTVVILGVTLIAGEMPPVDLRGIGIVLVSGAACFAVSEYVAPLVGPFEAPLRIIAFAAYPALLVVTGVIPAEHRTQLWAIMRTALRFRSRPDDLIPRIPKLPAIERRVVLTIARDGKPASRITALTGIPEVKVQEMLVSALRRLAEAGEPGEHDVAVGQYLLSPGSQTEQAGVERALWEAGVPPVELHQIESAFRSLCAAPAKEWSVTVLDNGRDLPTAPWPVEPATIELLGEVIRRERPRSEVARTHGIEDRDLDRRLIGALRMIGTGGDSRPTDGLIAAFLLDWPDGPPARQLWAAGVDPLELHQLELTLDAIRSLPDERWGEIVGAAAA